MRIGELAGHIGVSARSLRYYEQQGLLSPSRDANGYRSYDRLAAVRASNIRDLFGVGLTAKDVLDYAEKGCLDRPLSESPRCAAELETARKRLTALEQRIARLQAVRDRLASHGTELEKAMVTETGG